MNLQDCVWEILNRNIMETILMQSGLDEKWLAGFIECYCYLRNVQDLLADWKTSGDSENHLKTRSIRSEQWYELIAGGFWKGDILIADLEDLELLDAS